MFIFAILLIGISRFFKLKEVCLAKGIRSGIFVCSWMGYLVRLWKPMLWRCCNEAVAYFAYEL